MKKIVSSFKAFSRINPRDKKLNEFFKLPKNELSGFHDSEEASTFSEVNKPVEVSCPWEVEDLINKATTASGLQELFAKSTERENLRMSEKLMEKLNLGHNINADEDFKKREVDNEYANYDKYFESYKTYNSSEADYIDEEKRHQAVKDNFDRLSEKSNAQSTAVDRKRLLEAQKKILMKDLNQNKTSLNFLDYLRYKEACDDVEVNEFWEERSYWNRNRKEFVMEKNFDYMKEGTPEFEKDNRVESFRKFSETQFSREFDEDIKVVSKNPKDDVIYGRVSPFAKQEIYELYKEGWTVNKLSYKFGILPQRTKAIINQRELFWDKMFPKIGLTGYKRLLTFEFMYGSLYKFVDYGFDLDVIPFMSKGMFFKGLFREEIDYGKPPAYQYLPKRPDFAIILKELKKSRTKKYDKIPERFIGIGQSGYMVYNLKARRGHGAARVSQMFKRTVTYGDNRPDFLPVKVREKLSLGPRLATVGFANRNKRRFVA